MSPAITAGEPTMGQLAEQAAQAIRTLNHLTRPADALSDPIEAAELVAALAHLSGRLPQLLSQLTRWLRSQEATGRLRVDVCSLVPDPAAAVAAAISCLTQASQCAHRAGLALDAAHQHLAHLAAAEQQEEGR